MTLDLDITLPLDRFTLRVQHRFDAHITGLSGPSGAGKTSLLETIAGLRPGAMGRVALDGRVWLDSRVPSNFFTEAPPEQRDVGYVPQEGLLFPHRDVRSNLLVGADRARSRGLDPQKTLDEVCELLELGSLLDRRIQTLSGGEQRRVALGRAVCSGPRLLLLDEPLAALDHTLRRKIQPFLLRLRKEFEIPIVLVTHDPAEIAALCDEVIALRDGAVCATGTARDVLGDPRALFPADGLTDDRFENLLGATITTTEPATGTTEHRTEVQINGQALTFAGAYGATGDRVWVGVPAPAIWLTREPPAALEGVCVLEGRYRGPCEDSGGRLTLVTLDRGGEVRAFHAPPTRPEIGDGVYLLIRGADCTIYPAG